MMTAAEAYKVSVLAKRLKDKGLDLAEDVVAMIVNETADFISESAVASVNPYDDVIGLVMPQVKKKVQADFVDKIDGKDEVQ